MAMQVGATQEGEPINDINTTPLIDVMLVLLIMLIMTIPPQTHATKLDLPVVPPPPTTEEPPPPVAIDIDFDGSISWNGASVSRTEMVDYMGRLAALDPSEQNEIHIRPHRRTSYGDVAFVMASAQREGLTKMGVIGGVR
jgi:biopolymer transport protein ExbD